MPHALSKKQVEYLDFLQSYIRKNQRSPRLEEIAQNFSVKSPTVHKALKALMHKGYLIFGRDSQSGFFIRLIERAGSVETVLEVPITGKVNRYGEIYEFPKKHGHFASVLSGPKPDQVGALAITDDIPEASMKAGDLLIFDLDKKPQPGDISILPLETKLLIQVQSITFDERNELFDLALDYPMPEAIRDEDLHKWVNWYPLAWHEDTTKSHFLELSENEGLPQRSIPIDMLLGVAIRLSRQLAW